MTQQNPVLPDTSGAVYLAAANLARRAIASHHMGSTAPTYKENGFTWWDTSAGANWYLKVWDGASWITLLILDTTNDRFSQTVHDLTLTGTLSRPWTGWDPNIISSGATPGTYTYTKVQADTRRDGNKIDVKFEILNITESVAGSGTGNVRINTLPLAAVINDFGRANVREALNGKSGTYRVFIPSGGQYIELARETDDVSLKIEDISSGNTDISAEFSYKVA
jgi:hypothetical protein